MMKACLVALILAAGTNAFSSYATNSIRCFSSLRATTDADLLERIAVLEKELSLVKAANASPEDQARLINAVFAARQTSSLIAQPAINAAYAARDVTVMSSRWGSEEIGRVKGVSTPSPSRAVNDAYAARDVTVMSSRWGSEEIDRVKGVSTPSPSRTVNDAYAARDITVMSSRWGSEEIDRVTGTAVTLLVETPELSSERDGLVSDLRTEMAGLEAQLKDATKQIESLKKRLGIFEAAASPAVMAKAINSFFAK